MSVHQLRIACVSLVLFVGACDGQTPDAQTSNDKSSSVVAELEPGKTAASLQLSAVVELTKSDTVADAKALETKINDPEAKLNAVDLDGDGVTDFVEVVERREGAKTVLELRAIPSSKQDQDVAKVAVVVATVELHVENKEKIVVDASYSEHIEHDATIHVYHYERPAFYDGGVLVVSEGCFFHYVFVLEHELYLGHHHHVVVIETPHHHYKPKKHKKHKKHHKGHGVVVTW